MSTINGRQEQRKNIMKDDLLVIAKDVETPVVDQDTSVQNNNDSNDSDADDVNDEDPSISNWCGTKKNRRYCYCCCCILILCAAIIMILLVLFSSSGNVPSCLIGHVSSFTLDLRDLISSLQQTVPPPYRFHLCFDGKDCVTLDETCDEYSTQQWYVGTKYYENLKTITLTVITQAGGAGTESGKGILYYEISTEAKFEKFQASCASGDNYGLTMTWNVEPILQEEAKKETKDYCTNEYRSDVLYLDFKNFYNGIVASDEKSIYPESPTNQFELTLDMGQYNENYYTIVDVSQQMMTIPIFNTNFSKINYGPQCWNDDTCPCRHLDFGMVKTLELVLLNNGTVSPSDLQNVSDFKQWRAFTSPHWSKVAPDDPCYPYDDEMTWTL